LARVEKKVLKSLETIGENLMVKTRIGPAHVTSYMRRALVPLCGSGSIHLPASYIRRGGNSVTAGTESNRQNKFGAALSLFQKQQEIEIRRESHRNPKSGKNTGTSSDSQSPIRPKSLNWKHLGGRSVFTFETMEDSRFRLRKSNPSQPTLKGLRQSLDTDG